MVDVLGPIENLKKVAENVANEYSQTNKTKLRVVINKPPSLLKIIKKDFSLPEALRYYAAEEEEIAVQEEKSFLGFKRYKTVSALEYPYTSRCVVTADKNHEGLSINLREAISKFEMAAIHLS